MQNPTVVLDACLLDLAGRVARMFGLTLEQVLQTENVPQRLVMARATLAAAFIGPDALAVLQDPLALKPAMDRSRTAHSILLSVAKSHEIELEVMIGKSRKRPIVRARQVAMYLLRTHDFTLMEIAQITRRDDHSTARHGIGVVEERMAQDPRFSAEVHQLTAVVASALREAA